MSEHRTAVTRAVGSLPPRRHRWLIGAVAVIGASGLAFGGLGIPVSADEINTAGSVHASAEVQDDCVTAAVETGEAGGAVNPEQGSDQALLQADGQGTGTVSICRDDLGGPLPGDPGDPGPGDPGTVVPDDLDGIVPDDLGEILPGDGGGPGDGIVPDDLGEILPGDGGGPGGPGGIIPGGPGGGGPGGPGGIIPGGPGGGGPGGGGGDGPVRDTLRDLVGDGLGLVPGILDRVAEIIPPAVGGEAPDGDTGGGGENRGGTPGVNPPAGGITGSVAVAGAGGERDFPMDAVLGADIERDAPALSGTAVSPEATLPRTGGGLGSGLLRAIAFLGFGRVLFGLLQRRRPAVADGRA